MITGHTGFVGKALVAYLAKTDISIIGVARSNGFDLEDLMISDKLPDADLVVHLASCVGVALSWQNPELFYRTNYLTALTIAEYSRKRNIPIVFMSSYMYGDPKYLPIDEKHPVNCNNPYAFSKKIAEDIIFSYHKLFGINATLIRPMNLYGAGMPTDNLIGLLLSQAKGGNQIEVRDLSPKRDYLYIEDLCRAIYLIITNKVNGFQIYNLGSGHSHSVKELIHKLSNCMQKKLEIIETSEKRKNEISDCYADISKFANQYNWRPEIDLIEGLKRLIDNQ